MARKNPLIDKILDFKLATHQEICREMGERLKNQRLSKRIKQQDLANRAGVAVGTVKNIESKGQSSLESFIRIAIALDLVQELEQLFLLKMRSIAQMEQIERLYSKKIPRRVR